MYVASQVMQLGTEARFTAIVIFHRYCAAFFRREEKRSSDEGAGSLISSKDVCVTGVEDECVGIKKHLGIVAAACLFLGCKAEEEARRIRDVINVSHMLNFTGRNDGSSDPPDNMDDSSTVSGKVVISESENPPGLDSRYWEAKEEIVATEQAVLRLLKFDVAVSHPYRAVLLVVDALWSASRISMSPRPIITDAWKVLNRTVFTPEALSHPAMSLSCAAILLAVEESPGIKLPTRWWCAVGLSDDDILPLSSSLRQAKICTSSGDQLSR